MVKEYFEIMGVLLAIYALFRVCIGMASTVEKIPRRPESEPSNIEAHPIDTTQLSHRLEEVRRDYTVETHAPSPGKPLLVEERRAEIAKLAFFQRREPAESPEHEHGLPLFMV